MTSFAPLLAALQRERTLQATIASVIDRALGAALDRKPEPLAAACEELPELASRARAFAQEREAAARKVAPPAASLASIAELPGAPREALLALRTELRALTETVATRSRRLAALVRELGEIYGAALATFLGGAAGHPVSLVDTEV